MKSNNIKLIAITFGIITLVSCQKFDDIATNPNVVSENSALPPGLLLGKITFALYQGTGSEGPFDQVQRWNQFTVSNDIYYGGTNAYSWSNTGTVFDILKNVEKMEEKANQQLPSKVNAFTALGKFFRAYVSIYLSQRVGDIPMKEAGQGLNNLTPKYDSQHDVYLQSLQLLDTANIYLNQLIPISGTSISAQLDGDIYFNNNLTKWQKLVNTYKLRVLISLSKRADDPSAADLNIKQRFAEVINNPATFPIMTGNGDNMVFTYNQNYNSYTHNKNDAYNDRQNIGQAFLSLTTASQDPRTFIVATPAPAQLKAGKTVSDFSAYVGADIAQSVGTLSSDANSGKYSYVNYLRYYLSNADRSSNASFIGPESYIIIGFPEMNFNIAEAINRGWVTGTNAATYYLKGINASLDFYGLSEGQKFTVGDLAGATLGTVTISRSNFLADASVTYKGDNTAGLEQILNQKYIAFWQNSGYEAFYNQRRTGFPKAFSTTGPGINANGKIPVRWQYPNDENVYNANNVNAAIQNQQFSKDDVYQTIWLIK